MGVDKERRFHLRANEYDNLDELCAALASSPDSVLLHHCCRHDFSRWIIDVFRDEALATKVLHAEQAIAIATESLSGVTQRESTNLMDALGSWRQR